MLQASCSSGFDSSKFWIAVDPAIPLDQTASRALRWWAGDIIHCHMSYQLRCGHRSGSNEWNIIHPEGGEWTCRLFFKTSHLCCHFVFVHVYLIIQTLGKDQTGGHRVLVFLCHPPPSCPCKALEFLISDCLLSCSIENGSGVEFSTKSTKTVSACPKACPKAWVSKEGNKNAKSWLWYSKALVFVRQESLVSPWA